MGYKMKDAKIRVLEWLVNEATDEQLDGLAQIIDYGDIMAGLEGLIPDDLEDFLDEIRTEAVEEYKDENEE